MQPMKTHMDIDTKLLAKAMKLGGHRTKREAVNAALLDYINLRRREELLNLRGTLRWEGNLDQMRKRRVP
jgi:Arc/MetJ family transcription regulator